MIERRSYRVYGLLLLVCSLSFVKGCKPKAEDKQVVAPPPVAYKVDSSTLAENNGVVKPPIINITDTISEKRMVLVMKDSAASSELIGAKMFNIYNKILPKDDVPFLVDGNTEDVREEITQFALSLSNNVTVANDDERLKHHAAAVIVNNFTNHLYALTEDFCKKENISFQTLLPLIKETTSRLSSLSPSALQTGPAIRNDTATMELHKNIFNAYPELKKVYETLSESILRRV